jgi:Fis family transcriptional regulator
MTLQSTQEAITAGEDRLVVKERRTKPLRTSVEAALKRYFRDLNGHQASGLYQMVISEVEQPLLQTVLNHTGGNQSRAAEILGINRNTLRKKLKLYGIE